MYQDFGNGLARERTAQMRAEVSRNRLEARLARAAHREVAPPYVFVDRRPVGDMGTVRALAHSGRLELLLRDRL